MRRKLNLQAATYDLRAATAPQRKKPLSGIIYVVEPEGKGYAYVRFADAFVTALGKRMPRGIPTYEGAYLKVMYMPSKKVWRIFCLYAGDREEGILIHESKERPTWLGRTRRAA